MWHWWQEKIYTSASRWQYWLQYLYSNSDLSGWIRDNLDIQFNTSANTNQEAVSSQSLISYTMGVCQIEIVTAALFIYTVGLWCQLRSTICEKAGKKRGDNSRKTERCWWGLTSGKYIITHHHMLIVTLSSFTSVEDAVIVSLSVSLLSGHTSSLSAVPPLLKRDQRQQARCPRSTLKHVLNLAI